MSLIRLRDITLGRGHPFVLIAGPCVIESESHATGLAARLVEIAELPEHPWFLAVQFHPEFKSKPTRPHPLFASFVEAAYRHKTAHARHAEPVASR